MNDEFIISLTLISMVLVVYHHLVYPMILKVACKRRQSNRDQSPYASDSHCYPLPTVTIVVPAYNEQRWIAQKIRNLAMLNYPPAYLKVIVACDGCIDDTAAVARRTAAEVECQELNIEVRNFPKNRGKVAIINDVVSTVESELVALSDVSALISMDALLIAAERFKDSKLGVLNGHYQLLAPGSEGEQAYWHYQCQIKEGEAALGSTLGAHGAFYLFRRALFHPLAPEVINDDFLLPMEIVAAGFHADYEQRINILEQEKSTEAMDRHRRFRIAAGNLQQLIYLKRLLLPKYGRVAFLFFSGKGLRVLMPFLMAIALMGSLLLADYPLFLVMAVIQSLVYGVVGWYLLTRPRHSNRCIKTVVYLVSGHLAGLTGAVRYICGLERGHWKRVDESDHNNKKGNRYG